MFGFYLLTMLDSFNNATIIICVTSFIIGSILTGAIISACDGYFNNEEVKETIKIFKIKQIWLTFLISFVISTALPNTKQAAFIYIAPQLIENGAVRDTVKNIPELTKLGTEYLKDLLKQKTNRGEE